MAEDPTSRDPIVDRGHVEKILQIAGLDEQKIATALKDVHFPERVSHIAPRLADLGITRDHLIDRMGGSP